MSKFPRGLVPLITDIHALGFQFGMYSSAGILTCAQYAGSLGYEQIDAETFASWGVDYLKYDNCYNQGQSGVQKLSFDRYKVMSQALLNTGRNMTYSMCNWGEDEPWNWAQTIANSGRISGDIYDHFNRPDPQCPCTDGFDCKLPGNSCSVMNILNKMAPIVSRTMPGYFNDMDMLEVGNGGMSDSEYVLHFSMWAMHSSPLLIGTNVEKLSPADYAIYANPAIIALNQDPSGSAAGRIWRYLTDPDEYGQGEISMWARTLSDGDKVLALLNAGTSSMSMNASYHDIFGRSETRTFDAYDLWANRMSEDEARSILSGVAGSVPSNSSTRYNATAVSYADGIKNRHPALMGGKVGSIEPGDFVTTQVERHSVKIFRLRGV